MTRFDRASGSGFIRRKHIGRECAVHHSGLRGTILGMLEDGDRVEFDLIEGAAGPHARDVIRVAG